MRISDWSSDVCSSDLDTVLPMAREVLGGRHPQTQAAMQFLAEDSDAIGDTPRAIATYRELLAAREASLGADDWRTVDTAWQLEGLLLATGEREEAASIRVRYVTPPLETPDARRHEGQRTFVANVRATEKPATGP